jgi:Tol biopolymer transport system component/predicted Ser/Thr protein kinase
MIGRTIDRYDVVERLGQGGMGVVYKARDTTLDRFVALKVLPPDKSTDPERRQRFLGEAKAASALNHPGIVGVYDVMTVDGQDVIVMELVEGETLEQRLGRRRLPLTEALDLAIRITDALTRAHAVGIVHRDLKPSNVMVTPDGGVKILDFGLAKLVEAPFPDNETPTLSRHESLTAERVVVGTIAWMSPEQADGQPVDARSDIFALGAVLYEMLTGRHPFRRGAMAATLQAIREEEPELPTGLVPGLPVEAERAVLRCLRKDPTRRWQSVSDLGAVLEDLKEDSESGRQVVSGTAPGRRRIPWGLLGVVGALIVVVAATGALLLRREPSAPAPLELRRLTYDAGVSFIPTISPDGNLVAYTSDRGGDGALDIWVRHINQPEPVRLTRHPADDWLPRFSPDGSRVVFRSERDGGGTYIVNALGGNERRIGPPGLFAQFSPDGAHIAYAEDPAFAPRGLLRIFRVPVDRGVPELLVPGFGVWRPPGSTGPVWSPDGRLILFRGAPLEDPRQTDWWVAPVAGGEPRSSGAMEALPRIDFVQVPSLWLPGQLLFLAGTTIEGVNLYRARISGEGEISGPPEPLTAGPGMTWLPSASRDGRLALSRFQWVVHLWEVPLDPTSGRPVGPPRRITDDAAPKFSFSLTRDGDRLAYSAFSGSPENRRGEVRLQDRVSGDESVAVSMAATFTSLFPRLSPDGALLTWRHSVDRRWVASVAPPGGVPVRELCESCTVVAFFSDGKEVLLDRGRSLSRLDLASGEERTVLEFEGRTLLEADLSWDDAWLAVWTGEPEGETVLSVLPLRDPPVPPEEWIEITGRENWVGAPRWSSDGHLVYYLSDRDDFTCVWARALDPATHHPVGEPFPVAHAHDSQMKMMVLQRNVWSLAVAADRLVFNAAEASGDVYTALLPPID